MWPECVFTECEDTTVSRTGILYTCTPIFFTKKGKHNLSPVEIFHSKPSNVNLMVAQTGKVREASAYIITKTWTSVQHFVSVQLICSDISLEKRQFPLASGCWWKTTVLPNRLDSSFGDFLRKCHDDPCDCCCHLCSFEWSCLTLLSWISCAQQLDW